MESIDENFSKSGLVVSEVSVNNLRQTAKWAMFLGVVGFVFLGLMIIGGLSVIAVSGNMPSYARNNMPVDLTVLGVLYIVMAGIGFYPAYCLVRFSAKMTQSFKSKVQLSFDEATGFLKGHYVYAGIMTIVVIAIYIIAIVLAVANA